MHFFICIFGFVHFLFVHFWEGLGFHLFIPFSKLLRMSWIDLIFSAGGIGQNKWVLYKE